MTGNIKLLKHVEIDTARYNDALMNSGAGSIFMESWVLDALAPGWQLLVYGNYESILPVVVNHKFRVKFPVQPPFMQQFSVVGKERHTVLMLNFLRKKFYRGCINLGNTSLELTKEFRVKKRPNYVLNLNRSLEIIETSFSKDALKNLRKLRESGYTISSCTPVVVIETYRKAWGNLNQGLGEVNFIAMSEFLSLAVSKNKVELKAIYSAAGDLLAAGAFLIGQNKLHYILGGPTELGKLEGATHALIYQIIKQFAGTDMVLDFEGSAIPGVAYFYQKFGAVSEPFYQISWSKFPFDKF